MEEIKRFKDLQISPLAQLSRALVEFISEIMATQIEDTEGGEQDYKHDITGLICTPLLNVFLWEHYEK